MLRKEYDEQRSMHRKSMGLWMASMLAQETGQEVMNWGLNQDMFSAKQSLGVKTGASIKAMGGGMLWGSSVASLATGMGSSAAVAGPIGVAAAAVGMLVSVAQSMSDYSEKLQEAKQAQEQLTTVVKQRAKSMSNNFGPSVEKWQAEGMLRGYQSEIPFLVSQILNPYGDGEVGRYREFAKSVRVNTSYNRDVAYRRMIDA